MKFNCSKCGKSFILEGGAYSKCPDCGAGAPDFKIDEVELRKLKQEGIKRRIKNKVKPVRVNRGNACIGKDYSRCIDCGRCTAVCLNTNGPGMDGNNCIGCGQCILSCPTYSLHGNNAYKTVFKMLQDRSKVVVAIVAPAVKSSLQEIFKEDAGVLSEGRVIEALRKLGFNFVFDVSIGADINIVEEALELIERKEKGTSLPMFSGCCPSWVAYLQKHASELVPNVTSVKTPIGITGLLTKTAFKERMGLRAKDIITVAVTPCTAKKREIRLDEYTVNDVMNTNYVITVRELAHMLRYAQISFNELADSAFDNMFGDASGAGVIFARTGGVSESMLRNIYKIKTGKNMPKSALDIQKLEGLEEIKRMRVRIGKEIYKFAVVNGIANAKKLIADTKSMEYFDMIEVMACPGGCVGGGGQPKTLNDKDILVKRISAIDKKDDIIKNKDPFDGSGFAALYMGNFGPPKKERAKKLLHIKRED